IASSVTDIAVRQFGQHVSVEVEQLIPARPHRQLRVVTRGPSSDVWCNQLHGQKSRSCGTAIRRLSLDPPTTSSSRDQYLCIQVLTGCRSGFSATPSLSGSVQAEDQFIFARLLWVDYVEKVV